MRLLDHIVIVAVACMVVFTPLAIGSVHPPAFAAIEVLSFGLLIVWMAKLAMVGTGDGHARLAPALPLALPAALFMLLVLIQLCPLPASLLRVVSPATYQVYADSLVGFPDSALQRAALPAHPVLATAVAAKPLPAVSASAKAGAAGASGAPAVAGTAHKGSSAPSVTGSTESLWMPLAIAPELTRTALLKGLAYAALFFVVVFYPFGASDGERGAPRFNRAVLMTIVCTALVVALVGLAERAHWNGKILWFFVPRDWGAPQNFSPPRASGPFINPDHFANYLALVLPIALSATLMRSPLLPRRWRGAGQVFCGAAVFIIFCAILLSLSRGGWIGSAIGIGAVFVMLFSRTEIESLMLRSPLRLTRARTLALAAATAAVLVVAALMFVGETARMQADTRLGETVTVGLSLWERVRVWHDTLRLFRSFPLLGVGLGGFSEILKRYLAPPWYAGFYRNAHNDYLQLLSETGIVGFALAAWFFYAVIRTLLAAPARVSSRLWPVFAGIVAAIAVMAFHESVDFNLHTPANAVLFVLLVGIGVRMVLDPEPEPIAARERFGLAGAPVAEQPAMPAHREIATAPVRGGRGLRVAALGASAAACGLIVASLLQKGMPYPYDIPTPLTPPQAREVILHHPASSRAHLALVALAGPELNPALRLKLLRAAVMLDPIAPLPRDLYAQELLHQGEQARGLKEIARSVEMAPVLDAHFFLDARQVPWLSPAVRRAVDHGMNLAIADGYGSQSQLAALYGRERDYIAQARELAAWATHARTHAQRSDRLIEAARAWVKVPDYVSAEKALRQAAATAPERSEPYVDLALEVFEPQHKLAEARSAIETGINHGADPYVLSLALAQAYAKAGDRRDQADALATALRYHPWADGTAYDLASTYCALQDYPRAILVMQKTLDSRPDWSAGYSLLATAEEADFQYAAADRDYAHAVALDPKNAGLRQHYVEFHKRLAQSAAQNAADAPPSAPDLGEAPDSTP